MQSLSPLLDSATIVRKQPQKDKKGHSLLTLTLDYCTEWDSNTVRVRDLLSHHLKTSTLPSGDLLQNNIPLLEEAHR